MKGISFKNKLYQSRFDKLFSLYGDKLNEIEVSLIRITIVHFKKINPDEYYVLLGIYYGFFHFSIIDIDNSLLTNIDVLNIEKLKKSYSYELSGDKEKFIDSIVEMENDLFLLKMIIRYSILSSGSKYINFISDFKLYAKSIGYIIPYLTFKDFKYLGFFQDIYFKEIYPKEYDLTKTQYFESTNDINLPGTYIIDIVSDLHALLTRLNIFGNITLRKKSFFSIYNKIIRKGIKQISDSIGIRIIFGSKYDVYRFVNMFEEVNVYEKKKDYISSPKKNGYKSIHYVYSCPFRSREISVDLQLRTHEMNEQINDNLDISHFNYTLKEKKWDTIFEEIWYGYNYLIEKFNLNKKKKI